jgi:hypothetical protein
VVQRFGRNLAEIGLGCRPTDLEAAGILLATGWQPASSLHVCNMRIRIYAA